MSELKPSSSSGHEDNSDIWQFDWSGPSGPEQIVSDPSVQICSVSIRKNTNSNNSSDPWEIYGDITVQHHHGATAGDHLYNRSKDNPEIIYNGDTLTLSCPKNYPAGAVMILPDEEVVMTLNLKEKATGGGRDTVIALHCFILDTEPSEDGYEKVKCYQYSSDVVVITVCYIVIPCANLACVKVKVREFGTHSDDTEPTAVVHGSIVARYDDETQKYLMGKIDNVDDDGESNMLSSRLFKKPYTQPVTARAGKKRETIELSRSFVALPTYSMLVVELNLVVNECEIVAQTSFTLARQGVRETKRVSSQGFRFDIKIDWVSHLSIDEQKDYYLKEIITDRRNDGLEHEPGQLDRCILIPTPSYFATGYNFGSLPYGFPPMEIHSVLIGQISEVCSVYGEIRVRDLRGNSTIFSRPEQSPLILSPSNNIIPLSIGHAYDCWSPVPFPLFVYFDLKSVEGEIAIKGVFVQNEWYIEQEPEKWLDRPLCGLIKGDHGYAAVRYTLVSNSRQFSIKVTFLSKCSFGAVRFCGSIVSRYHYYDQSTCYPKDLYRTILLNQEDFQELASGDEIKLTKSAVVVPLKHRLVIEANLTIEGAGGLQGSVEFDLKPPFDGKEMKLLHAEGYDLKVEIGFY